MISTRVNWLARWSAAAACVVIAALYAINLRWNLVWCLTSGHGIVISDGGLGLGHIQSPSAFLFYTPGFRTEGALGLPRSWYGLPTWRLRGQARWIIVPLWMLGVPCATTAVVAWRAHRRRRPGTCPSCGYDLAGVRGGVCPECGAACPPVGGE